jgi:3-phosphoshikimate 1-carboxyvinyltransferase
MRGYLAMNLTIPQISNFHGIRHLPGDKSISHRALLIGAISDGVSKISHCSRAADPMSTLSCLKQLGLKIDDDGSDIVIHGNGRYGLQMPSSPLNAGNSGTTMRLISGILAGQRFPSVIIGDSSLSQRPMKRVIDPLRLMGAQIAGTEKNTAPLRIEPVDTLHAIRYNLPVPSAQVKSALIFAGLYTEEPTLIIENMQTRDHTERMLGILPKKEKGSLVVEINSQVKVEGKQFFVPGDISAAAFFLSAGLIVPGSSLRIHNVGLNRTRTRILDILRMMGGNIQVENEKTIAGEPIGDLLVHSSELKSNLDLRGKDIVELIDEVPILSVTALFAEGSFQIHDARELRTKETDRISAMVNNLRLLGCDVEEYEDGFAFESRKDYSGTILPSYGDHRIAMAFGVAGARIPNVVIQDSDCVDISFPHFWKELFSPSMP